MESNLDAVLQVLDELGIDYKKESNRAKMCCPWHDEKTPSFTIFDDNACFCFGCQKHCWHDELIAHLAGCSIVEAKKKLGTYDPDVQYEATEKITRAKLKNYAFADPVNDYSDAWEKLSDDIPPQMHEFLKGKGLEDYAISLGLWRWCPRHTFKCWENREGIAIPYFGPHGEVCTYRLREYDRMRQKFGHAIAPKGVPLQCSYLICDIRQPVYFCEGETDSLSMHALGHNVICLPGVGAHKQINSAIMDCMDWGVPELIFCGDNDEAGHKMNEYCKEAVYDLGLGIYRPKMRVLELPKEFNMTKDGAFKRKDINDFFVEGRLQEVLAPKKRSIAWIEPIKKDPVDVVSKIMGGGEEISQLKLEGVF